MENNEHNFDLQINEDEFHQWYNNWREEEMGISPTNGMFDIWMEYKIDSEFNDIKTLLGKILWYSIDQKTHNDLCTDLFISKVVIKNGKVIKEDDLCFYIEGYDKSISKKSLSEYVFLNKNSLLFNLHYDGEAIHSGKQIKSRFLSNNCICEELIYY